ncbi:hypothetical protein BGHDH14_bgh00119 [Blumeria hordei DH14]|uniref:PUA domain-containing protein n=1 Tax=Blumeria graminis f. sp. hordei (strain DH14) TaxID=546991 RepID=N1JDH6_BLUG1|nr:hypothetical protein BGHDH14_bgh00119 [Blumeria hordei DH14]
MKSLKIVIKLGTSSIIDEVTHKPLLSILSLIVETAVKLRNEGHKVVIVSSGAIGVGLRKMNYDKRPKHLPRIQALAAIGQCHLLGIWDQLFSHFGQPIAQILLTREAIAHRSQYLNAQKTFHELLEMGVIPIVNENDTIAVSEIKFGDNDTLSAITAAMIHAQYLFLMTDVDCLYDKNPRTCADACAIEVVEDISSLNADVSSAGSNLGVGGMSTKIVAARLATSAGVTTIITRSSTPGNIPQIVRYLQTLKSNPSSPRSASSPKLNSREDEIGISSQSSEIGSAFSPPLHTRFIPAQNPIRDRKFWLLYGLTPRGTLYVDSGAHEAIKNKAGLFAVGVLDVEGNFAQMESVRIVVVSRLDSGTCEENQKSWEGPGIEVGRAVVNFSASEISRIKGVKSSEIRDLLGYADSEYVALRENISTFG